jgi:PAS domain S-box-containing protein
MDTNTAAPTRRTPTLVTKKPADRPTERRFDRLTRLAGAALQVPFAIVSLTDDQRQFAKSEAARTRPWQDRRGTPISRAICRHVVQTQAPLVVHDAATATPLTAETDAAPMNVGAYIGMPLADRDGTLIGALCVIEPAPRQWSEFDLTILGDVSALVQREIAERKTSEQLADEARHWSAILNAMPQMLFVTGPESEPEGFNHSWYDFTGTRPEDEATSNWLTACHPDERAQAEAAWNQARDAGIHWKAELHLRHHTGAYRWTLVTTVPVRGENGNIERWFGSCTDIEDIKSLQEASEDVKRTLAKMLIKNLSEQATYAPKAKFNELRGLIAAVREVAAVTD